MNKAVLLSLLLIIVLLAGCHKEVLTGAVIPPSNTGYNGGKTLVQNYYDLVNNALDPKFNTTQTWTCSGKLCLGTPELLSSSGCNIPGNYSSTYLDGLTPTTTRYEIRSDMFSEAGLVLSVSNNATMFDAWYNTQQALPKCAGSLVCWVSKNIDGTLTDKGGDTATDGDARICIALYQASNNTQLSDGNRTKYRTEANKCIADVYQYDTATVASKLTTTGQNITRLPFSGKNCAATALSCGGPHWYNGYSGDIIKLFQIGFLQTNNITYDAAARNFTAALVSINVMQNPATGFGVACKDGNYVTSGTYLNMSCTQAYEWDDAPRFMFSFCDALRVANISNTLNGVYTNMSAYCGKWSNSSTYSATASCVVYNQAGTCANSDGGVLGNSYGMGMLTYYNQSIARTKLDTLFGYYDWSTKVFETQLCENGLTFRSSKASKALAIIIGLDEASMGYGGSGGGGGGSGGTNITTGNFQIVVNNPLNATATTNTTMIFNITVWNMNTSNGSSYTPVTLPQLLFNDTFTSNPNTNGYNVGSQWNWASNKWYYCGPANYSNPSWSPKLNLSSYPFGYTINFTFTSGDVSDWKFYFGSDGASATGDRVMIHSASGTTQTIQHDGGSYNQTAAVNNKVANNVSIKVNTTSNLVTFCINGNCQTDGIVTATTGDYVVFYPGANTQNCVNISQLQVFNTGDSTGSSTPTYCASADMNVTIKWTNGSIIKNFPGTTNGTTLNTTVNGLTNNTYNWSVNISTCSHAISWTPLTFNVSTTNPAPVITYVNTTNINTSNATIQWTTDLSSNTSINYGLTTGLGTVTSINNAVTYHNINATSLVNGTKYYYNVTSCYLGACNTTGPYNFTTAQPSGTFVLSDLVVFSVTNQSAWFSWSTTQYTNTSVKYGTTLSLGSQRGFNDVNLSHAINISGLTNSTLYYANITSCNQSTSTCVTTGPINFTTLSNGVPTISRCVNMTDIIFKTNLSRGTINPITFTYTEMGIIPVNQTLCPAAYYTAVAANVNYNVTVSTNLSNTNISLYANGQRINSTTNYTGLIISGNISYVNFTMDLNNTPLVLVRLPIRINVTTA